MIVSEKLYTVTEALKLLQYSYSTFHRAVQAGQIACVYTPGGWRRVPESEIVKQLRQLRVEVKE